MNITSRKEALSTGATRYYSGKPCIHGHLSERFSTSGSCVSCYKDRISEPKMGLAGIAKVLRYDQHTGELFFLESLDHAFAGKPVRSISHGKKSRTSYYRVNIGGKFYLAHRVAWLLHYGEWPNGQIDHIDGNGLNNKIGNIRCVQSIDNMKNCRLSKNNKSGVNGVWMQGGRYVAEIMVNRKKISLGTYSTLDEARNARLTAEDKYKFHELHGSHKPL